MKAPEKTSIEKKDFLTKDTAWKIIRAQKFERSGDISFTIEISGITIYGAVLKWSNKNGKWFVSWPSRKGNDGEYYKHVYIPLTDGDTKKIEDAIEEALSK
mgnify:CR=1 FL=1